MRLKQLIDGADSMHILDEIVKRRKEDIQNYGFGFGAAVPEKRTRGITPFLVQKGAILEIKRASPSKGDIAPNLDASQTAQLYAQAGAAAVSILTEQRYFKGSLDDLQAVCRSVDSFAARTGKPAPAVLRKDFLLCPEEVDVAYMYGADAVLLIARILDDKTLLAMAGRCRSLGISALLELRLDDDLRKLSLVVQEYGTESVVCGVNARNLSTFAIDLLAPAGIRDKILHSTGTDMRVVFESGIRTPSAAAFAGSMGFSGMLLGEAAARNPGEAASLVRAFETAKPTRGAAQWLSFAEDAYKKNHSDEKKRKPLVKVCGLTGTKDALQAAEFGADFLGFIFCAKSPRNVDAETVRAARKLLAKKSERPFSVPKIVCVITECDSAEGKAAIELVRDGTADFLQLHGRNATEQFFADETLSFLPHYAAVNVSSEEDLAEVEKLLQQGEPRILIDAQSCGKMGGTGMQVDRSLCEAAAKKVRQWLAGGISAGNIREIVQNCEPELVDVNSGIESAPGKKDRQKMADFFSRL